MMKQKILDPLKTLAVAAVIIGIWAGLSAAGVFSSFVFPGPAKVWQAALAMAKSGELFTNLFHSLLRVLTGFCISFALAFGAGLAAALCPKADPFYKPILEFMRNVPPMSLIPLLILWFGIGEVPKIIVIVLTSFFPIFMNTEAGLRNCDRDLLEVGQMLRMSRRDVFLKIRIPDALPDILVGMQIGLGYSWRAIVGAEMIAAASGVGYMILDAQALSRTDKVLVGIILIGVLGLVTDKLFGLAVKQVNRRMGQEVHDEHR